MTATERVASANYYRELGQYMGIRDIPATHQEFSGFLDEYERDHFGFDSGGRRVADATLRLMTTFPPNQWAPTFLITRLSYALMDPPLLAAFGYPQRSAIERTLLRRAVWQRGRVVRLMRPRIRPFLIRDLKSIRSYPDGYDVRELGTFPPVRG